MAEKNIKRQTVFASCLHDCSSVPAYLYPKYFTYGKGNRTRVRSKNSWRTTTRLFGAGMWRTRAGLRAVLVGVCIGIVRCNASITKCPGPGEQDASWFPGDVVDCAGPCITKIVPTGEAAAPIGDGGAVSKLAMQDECGDIVAQGGAISSVCAVKFTGHFHMPPGMQEADDVFFATDAFSSSFNERIKLWVDNSLLIDQWSSLSSNWPTSAAQKLDADVSYKVVVEYTTTDYNSKKLDLHISTAGGVGEMTSLMDLPLQSPVMGASRTPVKVETSCYGAPPQEGAFSLVLATDPSRALAWGNKRELNDEWNLYNYDVVTVPASSAGGFMFVGNKVAYLDDEFLGIEYNCGILKGGISSQLLRSRHCTEVGTCGREFVANADGSVSPVADMSLVLGWGPVTEDCGGTRSGDEDGFILVDAGSPNRVVMSSYPPSPHPLLCLSDEVNGTSLYVDHAEGYSWQCCRGDDCLAKFTALRQLDIYPSEEVCQSKPVRECTDPVVSAYKCQHARATSSQPAVTGFELIDTGKPDCVLTDTLPGLEQTQPGLEGALAHLWRFVVLVYIVR